MKTLTPLASVSILTIVDNYSDLLLDDSDRVQRTSLHDPNHVSRNTLLAEHGLCLQLTAQGEKERTSLLLDAGYTEVAVPHNMDLLNLDLDRIDAWVLSHGHMDHFGALLPVLERLQRPLPLIAHPRVFSLHRYVQRTPEVLQKFPVLDRNPLEERGARIQLCEEPYWPDNHLWFATGPIPRKTTFEQGVPTARIEVEGKLVHDSIVDDQAVVFHLRKKGLVIVSGCAHAGLINTVQYACDITGIEKVHAVVGGFHLGGTAYDTAFQQTLEHLLRINPDLVVPMHCTGLRARQELEQAFGARCLQNSVGTRFHFD
jgi:7,8-dihydropterin-6-yl-methyl-4-(beta-D-ribofuranosyl)aminobenzene 5'-phosphate synthase